MIKTNPFLIHILHLCEFIAMFIGILKFKSVKNTFWKWFVYYLVYVFIYEVFSDFFKVKLKNEIGLFMSYIQIPIEYLFLFWLYAYISLKNKKIFWIFSGLYLITYFIDLSVSDLNFSFKSLNTSFATLLLLILVFLEFKRQIRSDSIIYFKEDKMFYINIGVILLYIGTMPFFGWYKILLKYPVIWNTYYIYFMISNCIMYLLFAASFIWGKPK